MTTLPKITFEVPYEKQIEIETVCVNEGKSFSQYFLGLHERNIRPVSKCVEEDIPSCTDKKETTCKSDRENDWDLSLPKKKKGGRPKKMK